MRALNEFETSFTTYTKGNEQELKWTNFASTDLKSMSLVAVTSKNRIPLTRKSISSSANMS